MTLCWRGVDSNFRFRDALSGADVNRSRAADDFAPINARMEELRREREGTRPSEKEAQRDLLLLRGGAIAGPRDQRGARSDPPISIKQRRLRRTFKPELARHEALIGSSRTTSS